MNSASLRSARAAVVALLVQFPASALTAQSALSLSAVRSPGFGGGGLFVSPYATTDVGPFRGRGELEISWGESTARAAHVSVSMRLPGDVGLSGTIAGRYAAAATERLADRSFGVTLARGRGALALAHRRGHAEFEGYTSELAGLDVRVGLAVGTPLDLELGITRRSATVLEHGDLEVERRIIVAGYEFISARRLQYMTAARHQDVELELSARLGPVRVGAHAGRGFSDGEAPDRGWAYARLAAPVARQLEVVAETGRNGGVPAIGRVPQSFARVGVRMRLHGDDPEPALRSPAHDHPAAVAAIERNADGPRLVITAAGASAVEVKGDFTAWAAVPMSRMSDGRWFVTVREGLLHFNIRIDGRDWSVPSGVPAVPDEFSGAPVAVVVVGSP